MSSGLNFVSLNRKVVIKLDHDTRQILFLNLVLFETNTS